MSTSLTEIRTTAVKVEVVSTFVWSHTTPHTSIETIEGTLMFVRAFIACVTHQYDSKLVSLYITTKDRSDWMYRRPLEAKDLLSLAMFQFLTEVPKMAARVFDLHICGYFGLKSQERRTQILTELTDAERQYIQSIESGLLEYRQSIVPVNDKVEEASTAAEFCENICEQLDEHKKNQNS